MSNIVISSDDQGCQSAKDWFVKHQKFVNDINELHTLQDGEKFYVIAHDDEMGDGSLFIDAICKLDYPMTDFQVVLIVCSAHSYKFSKSLLTPAELIANHFKRSVWASTNIVTGMWSDDGNATFKGNYVEVKPGTDLESLFQNLSIND